MLCFKRSHRCPCCGLKAPRGALSALLCHLNTPRPLRALRPQRQTSPPRKKIAKSPLPAIFSAEIKRQQGLGILPLFDFPLWMRPGWSLCRTPESRVSTQTSLRHPPIRSHLAAPSPRPDDPPSPLAARRRAILFPRDSRDHCTSPAMRPELRTSCIRPGLSPLHTPPATHV